MSVFLLMLINRIELQVEARETVIHVPVEMGFIKTRRARLSATPSQRGVIPLLLWWYGLGPELLAPPPPLSTFLPLG